MVGIYFLPEFQHLADETIVTLTGCAVSIQLALGAEFYP